MKLLNCIVLIQIIFLVVEFCSAQNVSSFEGTWSENEGSRVNFQEVMTELGISEDVIKVYIQGILATLNIFYTPTAFTYAITGNDPRSKTFGFLIRKNQEQLEPVDIFGKTYWSLSNYTNKTLQMFIYKEEDIEASFITMKMDITEMGFLKFSVQAPNFSQKAFTLFHKL
ncbi:uncharacterized protein [Lepeophtheirus salmonis]|nr:uncharacterized protein LOC121130885 [Lepeophtheirus salmonis]